jgi:hypothetical protein
VAAAALAVGLGVAVLVKLDHDLLVGPFAARDGVQADSALLGERPDVVPGVLWAAFVAVSLAGAGALLLHAADRLRALPRDAFTRALVLTAALLGAGIAVRTLTNVIPPFDRYLLPIAAVLLVAVARRSAAASAPRLRAAAAVVVLNVAVAVPLVVESAGFDAGRWEAGEALVARGYAARDVDAGHEWTRWQSARPAGTHPPEGIADPVSLWIRLTVDTRSCALVASSRLTQPWLRPLGTFRYATLLHERTLFLYANPRSCVSR